MSCVLYTVCDQCLRAGDERVSPRRAEAVCCRCLRCQLVTVVTHGAPRAAG